MDFDNLAFNAAAFIASLFLLEWGADRFIDHTVVISRRLGVSPVLVSLLTAGAEWEELAVVIAAIGQRRPTLALGNVIGSSISNILGAFALGLLFHPGRTTFDRSSKIYTAILLAITSIFVFFLAFFSVLKEIAGPILIAFFIVYVISIAFFIYRGVVSAPEDSDSDSDSGSGSSSDSGSDSDREDDSSNLDLEVNSTASTVQGDDSVRFPLQPLPKFTSLAKTADDEEAISSSAALLEHRPTRSKRKEIRPPHKRPKRLLHHVVQLVLGFLALSISCFVLSHSVSTIGDELGLSGSLVGVTVLSLATTLPEKFLAVIGGARGQGGIVVANTAGSNIFLLTLCAGILFTSGDKTALETEIRFVELVVMWVSSVMLCVAVFLGADRKIGAILMALYIAFLVAEFTVFRR